MKACRRKNVQLVDHGVLKTFLMSRSPLVNIPQSNGHGRRQLGYVPVARQGNLIVSSTKTVTDAQLRQQLIDLVKQQGKPYGLLIDDIAGGFTFTGRSNPQAFQVLPLVVYKVFPDGRPDRNCSRREHRGHAAGFAREDRRDRRQDGNFQRLLRRGIGLGARFGCVAGHPDLRNGICEERNFHGQAADPAAAGARYRTRRDKRNDEIRPLHCSRRILFASLPQCRSSARRASARACRAASTTRPDASRHARRNGTRAHASVDSRRGQTLLHRIPAAGSRRPRRHRFVRRAAFQLDLAQRAS